MKRKRLTRNQKAELFEAHDGKCWRCGLPIDPVKQPWHVGHVGVPHALGGDIIAPEHVHCNMGDAPAVTKAVAKANRNRADRLGIKKPSIFPSAKKLGLAFNWARGRYERLQP